MPHVRFDEPVDEGLGPWSAVHDFTTGVGHDDVGFETEATEVFGITRRPTRQHGLGRLGMELGGQEPFTHHGLRTRRAPGDLGEPGRHRQNVEMPLQPGTGCDHVGAVGFDVMPPHLGPTGPFDGAPQGSGRDLSSETNGEKRNPLLNSTFHEFTFGTHRCGDIVPVHAPLRSEEKDEIVSPKLGPLRRMFPEAIGQGHAVVAEPLPHDAGVGIVDVGDHEGAHTGTVGA